MTRNLLLGLAGLAALLAFAPAASAEYYEGKPDCPPDMACTMGAPGEGRPTDDCVDWCPRDGGDGNATGPDAPVDDATCMDGSAEGCDPDVHYFGDGPADTGVRDGREPDLGAESAGADAVKGVPALGALGLAAGLAGAALLLARRR